jgi:hypothetical protein
VHQPCELHYRSPVSEGFVGDPWLSITLTLCHILHSVSHWPVLVYYFYTIGVLLSCSSSSDVYLGPITGVQLPQRPSVIGLC